MSNKDIFGDDIEANKNDFANLFENSLGMTSKKLKKGDEFRGEIISFDKESVFVSTGTPTDGILPKLELLNDDREFLFKKGDFIDVVVVRVTPDETLLRYKSAKSSANDLDSLEDAYDMELPIEGKVTEVVKGGFRVLIHGKTTFCPVSQMDFKVDVDQEKYIGQKFDFLITQYESKGRNIVVSRRRVLDQQKVENEGAFLLKFHVGDIVSGKVTKLEKYGAFVEIDKGIEGLVHISEIAWGRIQNASDVLSVGQVVQVKILKIEDQERMKISLSIKEGGTAIDPWSTIETDFPVGKKINGTIEKKEVFGMFISIAPGIQGLLPRSKWKDSAEAAQYESKKKGETIAIQIDQINKEDRKISFGLPGEDYDDSWKSHSSGAATKKGLGTFADLLSKAQKKK
jgi:small subunit ribosomal protein S1